jgi:uncharacterized cupredoxin-like copper-binding protein
MRRTLLVLCGSMLATVLGALPALACGGLVSPNGTVALVRTTTLAAYHNGLEHYVTGFEFAGEAKDFGSIIPLPGVPSRVIRGGDWTLQRLVREVTPPAPEAFDAVRGSAALSGKAVVLQRKKIDALDVTILKGGGFAVGKWATGHGFRLSPDAPQVLDFYARRSPIFMAVQFDASRAQARGESTGDSIPVHLVIPTDRPWVPLRILALGAQPSQGIEADLFLLNDRAPALLPVPRGVPRLGPAAAGLNEVLVEQASPQLLTDLRSDRGMKWLPSSGMWLSYLQIRARASELTYDLAIDPTGNGRPSPVDAGLTGPGHASLGATGESLMPLWLGLGALALLFAVAMRQRRGEDRPVIGIPARRRTFAVGAIALVLLAGCARAAAQHRDPPLHGMRTVHVTIKWSRFHPAQFSFPEGTTVRFVIHNSDPIEHEFILGSKRVQDYIETTAHADHDGSVPGQITVPPGTVRNTTYTFAGVSNVLLGCHLPGHYAYGMRGFVTVEA